MEPSRTDVADARELLGVLTALKNGDFSRLMREGQDGIEGEIAAAVNHLVRNLNPFAVEVTRLSREIGTAGIFGGQASVEGLPGTWLDLVTNLNTMAANLTDQVRDIARAVHELAEGSPTGPVTVPARGEMQALKESLNALVDRAGRG